MIGRIVWFALLAMVAAVTVGVQLDRQARKNPTVAFSVPGIFRSSAQLPVAAYALGDSNSAAALEEAEKLVRRRPLPARHLSLLAQAQASAGRTGDSLLTIQYAAQRGWRDPIAQEAMLRLALQSGDEAEAARRYAALFLRQDTSDALLNEFGPQILAQPGGAGRMTLTEIVGGGERWHTRFLRRGARIMPPDAFVEIVEQTTKAGTRYDCKVLKQVRPALAERDESAAVRMDEVLAAQC